MVPHNAENFRIVVIGGASGGIGSACCTVFASSGWRVLALSRSFPNTKSTEGAITRIRCDFSESASVKQALNDALTEEEGIDAVIHCIGDIPQPADVQHTPWMRWENTLRVCLGTAIELANGTYERVCARSGSYIFISSVASRHTYPGIADYCAAKSALETYSEHLALSLATKGGRSNCIAPAVVDTRLLHKAPFSVEEAASWHKLGRVGAPHEIAEMAHYLAGSASAWITGQTIVMDGGMLL